MKNAIALVTCAAIPAVSVAQGPVEISEDGLAMTIPGLVEPGAVQQRGASLPFGAAPDFEVNLRRQVGGLEIADMDGDGRNDLVAVCYISNSFPPYEDWRDMIFYNSANGLSAQPGWVSDNQTHTGDVEVGDLNGDGANDLVVVHGSLRRDTVQVYMGAPGGPATSPGYSSVLPQSSWGTSGVLFDVENDGDLDLMTTNQGVAPNAFRPMYMFLNDGSGLESTPSWQSDEESIQNGLAAIDFDGNGFADIGVAKWVNFTSGVYANDNGNLSTAQTNFGFSTDAEKGAAFGDIDGFGPEFVVGGDPTTAYSLTHGAIFQSWQGFPPFSGPQEVVLHDADGDGDLDLAEVHFSDGRTHIYQNNAGSLDTTPTWTFDASQVGNAIAFGDLNNDGRDDLAIGYSGDVSIRVFYAQAPDCPADLAPPAGVLDLADVQAFIIGFTASDPAADLAAPFGVFDLADLQAFVAAFVAGCP